MKTIDLPLSDALRTFVDVQAAKSGFASGGEYIAALLERERLREMILDGSRSGVACEVDDAYFAELRALAKDKAA